MRRAKQIATWGLLGLAGLLAVVAITVTVGFSWLRSDSGRDWLARQIENAASTPGEMQLSIGEIAGALPQSLVARNVVISDSEGPWLTISAVEIGWRPWRLLDRTIDVERIELSEIALARLPASPPEAESDEGGGELGALLDFPLKFRLGRLAVDEIALGEPVLGQAARFSLTGDAQRGDDGTLATSLALKRIDSIEGDFTADVAFQPRSDHLTVDIEAISARGGLLAALLDRPDLPGSDLKLAGSGPLSDWSGDFTLALGDLATAQGDLALQRDGNGIIAFRLDGTSDVHPPQDSGSWLLAGGHGTITLKGAWQNGRRLQIDGLAIANEHLRLDLQGDVVPAEQTLDLQLTAASDEALVLAQLAGLDSLQSLGAEIAVSGSFGRPQADLDLRAAGLAAADIAADAVVLTGTVAAERDLFGSAPLLTLRLDGRLDGPRLLGQDAVNQVLGDTLPLRLAGRLDLASLRLDIDHLQATTGTAAVSASGPFNLADGTARLATVIEVQELAGLQPLTSIGLQGSARLVGPVTLERFGDLIAADLEGRWEQPGSDVALVAAIAGEGLDLGTRLTIDGGALRIEEAAARSPTTELDASLAIADGELRDGRYRLRLADAKVLTDALGVETAGPATVEGTLAGAFDALALSGNATLQRLAVADQRLTDLSGRYDLRLSGSDIDGPIEVALTSPYGRAEATTDLRLRSEAVTLDNLRARLPQTSVRGRVTVPLDGGDPSADLAGEFGDLGPWLQLAGFAGGGSGRIALTLNEAGTAAPFTVDAELSSLRFAPGAGAAPITADRVTMTVEGQDPGFSQPGRIDIAATTLRWSSMTLERAAVGARGTLSALDVTLDSEGQWLEPFALAAAASVTQQDDSVTVRLERAEGRAFGQPLALRGPATVTHSPTETRIDGLALTSGEASLIAEAALGADRLMLDASLESLPLAVLDAFWNSGLGGQLSATVNLNGSFAAPRGTARLTATDLRPRDSEDMPALQLDASAQWQEGRVTAEGQLGGAEIAAARFSADAPLRMTADGAIELPPEQPIAGHLDWSGNIKTLLLFVPLPQHRLDGRAEVAVAVSGTLGSPEADGHIALMQGRYENLEMGTILSDLTLLADISKERVTLAELGAVDGAGGKISGSGELALDPDRDFPFDLAVSLDKFHAVRRDDVTAVTSGRTRLHGDLALPQVEGRFTTETVEISLLAQLPPTVVSLDVIEVKDGVAQEQPPAADKAPPFEAVLDVVVEMPRRVFVRGRGLDSEWSGRLSVQGPASSPSVTGTLDLVRGELSVVGKPFTLKAGKVTLPEGAETDPALDVTAVHQGSDLTVTARLSGPLSQPELDLSSVPPVPRDEIVSRVLFNKSAAQLSAAEAAQLAMALRDLTGQGGGTDILGFARRTLGVDVLRVETAEDNSPALEVGKYLTDEVYVGVKQGADSQSTAAGVEVELTPNITLESEMTGRGANKSGVRFQWDY